MTQLTLVIDLNVCVGCHACEEPPCVSVCPTGASYKREDNGVVLVDYDKCIGLLATIATFALFICTAMIYASVKFLQEWYSPMTVANFTFPGVASGFMLAAAYSAYLGNQTGRFLWHPRRHRDPDGAGLTQLVHGQQQPDQAQEQCADRHRRSP